MVARYSFARHHRVGVLLGTMGLFGLIAMSAPVAAHGIPGGLEYTPGQVVVLGLTVAFMWGAIPVLNKRGFQSGGTPLVAASVIVVTGLVTFWSALLILHGPRQPLPQVLPAAWAAFLVGGLFGTAVGRIAMFIGVDRVGANITSGVIATNPAPAFLGGYFFLGEGVTPLRLLGIGIIIGGLVGLALSRGGDLRGWELKDLTFPLLSALVFGGGHVLRRYGMTLRSNPLQVATPLEAAAINELAAAAGILAFSIGYGRIHTTLADIPRRAYLYFIAAGIAGVIGLYTEFVILIHEKAAVVTALVATQVLFATVLTYLFLDDVERITRQMLAAILVVIVGLILLGL